MVTIVPVTDRRSRRWFLDVPAALLASEPAWPYPLRHTEAQRFSPRHPFYRHGDAAFWVALRDGTPVGRVSTQINTLHATWHGPGTGHFGHWQCADDPEVAAALMNCAERWLAGKGACRIEGPFSLSINEETGLLTRGFELAPMLLMPYHMPYAQRQLQELGFRRSQTLLAYRFPLSRGDAAARRMEPMLTRITARFGDRISVYSAHAARMEDHLQQAGEIFNQAWQANWGFVPMTPEELAMMARRMRPLIRPEFALFTAIDGRPAAVMVAAYDANQASLNLQGRLLPYGWAKLLFRLRTGRVKRARIVLLGVLPQWQQTPEAAAALTLMLMRMRSSGIAFGIDEIEGSWVLAGNHAMNAIFRSHGIEPTSEYAVFERSLINRGD